MKIALHIGLHKTGSTAIQFFGSLNRERLAAQHVLYPAAGCPPDENIPGHHELAWAILGQRELGVYDSLRNEINSSDAHNAIISSEVLDTLLDNQISMIRQLLHSFDVTVYAYLRRQDTFVQAMYTTDVMWHGCAVDIQEYIKNRLNTTLNYQSLLARWAGAFGADNIIVKPYTPNRLKGGDIILDFASSLGVNIDRNWSRPPPLINSGFPSPIIELIRDFRAAGVPQENVERLRRMAIRCYSNTKSKYDLLSPNESREILAYCLVGNRAIAQQYLGESSDLFESNDLENQQEWEARRARPFFAICDLLREIEKIK